MPSKPIVIPMSITTFYTNKIPEGDPQISFDEIFLLYSKGFEHGPGIKRDGMGEPWMEDRYRPERIITNPIEQRLGTWLIDNQKVKETEQKLISTAMAKGEIPKSLTDQWMQELENTENYFDVFRDLYPEYEIKGMQSNGNHTMNKWFVAALNSKFTGGRMQFNYLPDEEPAGKIYSCLVKWKENKPPYTVEDLKFDTYVERVRCTKDDLDITDEIEFVVFGQKLVENGQLVDFGTIANQFADIRHLYKLPNINPSVEFDEKKVYQHKKPRMLFTRPRENDVWFGERQMTRDEYIDLLIHALTEPVVLDINFDGMSALEDLIEATFKRDGYRKIVDQTAPPRSRGEWRWYSDRMVQIYFQRNVYAYTMLGINTDGNVIAAAAGGQAGRIGQTLEAMAQNMVAAGSQQVLLIDEGNDVFQWIEGEYRVLPLRGRVRSVFVFAQRKREES